MSKKSHKKNTQVIKISVILSFLIFHKGLIYAQDLDEIGKEDIFKYNGGLNISSMGYGAQGMENRQDPLFYTINANLNLSFFNVINAPLSIHYSKNNYTYNHPTFNHFGISPNYKFLTIHAGYRSMQFSSYSLSGLTFMGGGIEIKPENLPFKFHGMYGRFAKAVPFSEDHENYSSNNRFNVPGYERWGYGGKLTIGKKDQIVDLILFRAKDDPSSIPDPGPESGIVPKENLVIGFNTKNKIAEQISLQAEYTLSAFTKDTRLPERKMETFTYVNNLGDLFKPRYSTSVNGAFKGNLNYSAKTFSIGVAYNHVPPGYKSLGTTYLSNDFENVHLNFQKSFFKNKLSLSGNLGSERNNLDQDLKNTDKRLIWGINSNIALFNPLVINFNYSNFNSSTRPVETTFRDTFKYVQVNENYGFNASYQLKGENLSHNFNINSTYQTVNNLNRTVTNLTQMNTQTFNSNFNYNLTLKKLQLNLISAFNYNYFKPSEHEKNISYGPTFGGSKTFIDGQLRTYLNYSIQKNILPGNQRANMNIFRLNGSYKLSSHHNLRFTMSLMSRFYNIKRETASSVQKEYKARLTYSFNF